MIFIVAFETDNYREKSYALVRTVNNFFVPLAARLKFFYAYSTYRGFRNRFPTGCRADFFLASYMRIPYSSIPFSPFRFTPRLGRSRRSRQTDKKGLSVTHTQLRLIRIKGSSVRVRVRLISTLTLSLVRQSYCMGTNGKGKFTELKHELYGLH